MRVVNVFTKLVSVFALSIMLVTTVFANDGESGADISDMENAKKILPILWLQPAYISDDTAIMNVFKQGINAALAEKENVVVLDYEDSDAMFQEYLMENDMYPLSRGFGAGFIPKKVYLKELATMAGADYVLVINTMVANANSSTKAYSSGGASFSYTYEDSSYEITTLFNVMLYSVADNKYLLNKHYSIKKERSEENRAFLKSCEELMKKKFTLATVEF